MENQGVEETTQTLGTSESGKLENEVTPADKETETPLTNGDASIKDNEVSKEEAKEPEALENNIPVEKIEKETKVEEAIEKQSAPVIEEKPKDESPVEEVKVEESKQEEPKVEEPKKEEPQVDEIKEQPKSEEVKLEEEVKNEVVIVEKVETQPPVEVAVEESKEVRNEEIPPPLPSSNPPSPVTVFAESTMADAVPTQVDITEPAPISETTPKSSLNQEVLPPPPPALEMGDAKCSVEPNSAILESSPVQSVEQVVEPISESFSENVIESVDAAPIQSVPSESCVEPPLAMDSSSSVDESAPLEIPATSSSPVPAETLFPAKTDIPDEDVLCLEPILNAVDQVINADSLPDISTESLPSLPEPSSESLPEPMSLPPVDCVPEPIAPEPIPNIPLESEKVQESVADIPLPPAEVVLTNGDAHGPPSPVITESTISSQEAPIKQVVSASEISATESTEEERHVEKDKAEIVESAAVVPPTTEE